MEIAWTEPALATLEEALAYIAEHDPDAAQRLQNRVLFAVERVAELPYSGRMVPELKRTDVREVIVRPYRVIYRVTESHIVIWAVFQGRRLVTEDIVADEPE